MVNVVGIPLVNPYPSIYNYNNGGTNTAGETAAIVKPKAKPKGKLILKHKEARTPIATASTHGEKRTSNNTTNPFPLKSKCIPPASKSTVKHIILQYSPHLGL